MIKVGSLLKVYAYKSYKNNPELNEDIGIDSNKYGSYQKFQTMDTNGHIDAKRRKGFTYIDCFSAVPLRVGDTVRVKELLYLKKHGLHSVLGIKIYERDPMTFDDTDDVGLSNDGELLDLTSDIETF